MEEGKEGKGGIKLKELKICYTWFNYIYAFAYLKFIVIEDYFKKMLSADVFNLILGLQLTFELCIWTTFILTELNFLAFSILQRTN